MATSKNVSLDTEVEEQVAKEFGGDPAWKAWVNEKTREEIVNRQVRALYEQKMAEFEAEKAQIESDAGMVKAKVEPVDVEPVDLETPVKG